MTEPRAQTPRARGATPPSLRNMVLSVAALAAVAAVLVWSLLVIDLLRKRSDAAAASSATPTVQLASPDHVQPQTPAPVTTRTS